MAARPESRPLSFQLGLLHAADGSAQVAAGASVTQAATAAAPVCLPPLFLTCGLVLCLCPGNTVVFASVVGPRGLPARKDVGGATRAQLEVTWRPDEDPSAPPLARDRASLALQVSGALNSVFMASTQPRTGTHLTVQVRRDDGSLLAAALNAACAAACDAGVPLTHLLAAACVALDARGGVLVDPTAAEEAAAACVLTCAFKLPPSPLGGGGASHGGGDDGDDQEEVVLSHISKGSCTVEQLVAAVAACRAASHTQVVQALRRAVEGSHARHAA